MGVLPSSSRPIYAAAKAFVISLTKSVSGQVAQWPGMRIRINAIAPGRRHSVGTCGISGTDWDKSYVGTPLGRPAKVQEIAPVILFLADQKSSSYVTGSVFAIDGGFTASLVF